MGLVVVKAVKEFAKGKQAQVSGDFSEALDKEVLVLLEKAVVRAAAGGRKTLRPCDL